MVINQACQSRQLAFSTFISSEGKKKAKSAQFPRLRCFLLDGEFQFFSPLMKVENNFWSNSENVGK